MIKHSFLVVLAIAWGSPLAAQETPDARGTAILRALNLPAIVDAARVAGVGDSVLRGLLTTMRDRDLAADEAEMALKSEVEAVRAGGPVDNFGAFVRENLDAGLRGLDLAQAIRAAHRARGLRIPGLPDRPDRIRGRAGRTRTDEDTGEAGEEPERGRPDRMTPGRDTTRSRRRN